MESKRQEIFTQEVSSQEIFQEFIDSKAILKGHFILSSGLHSDTYLQCARVLMNPNRAEKLCKLLALKIKKQLGDNPADLVVSPAMGGVIIGYELARQLNLPAIFCERVNGKFELRRGFEINANARILIVEDVITTGKSSLETFELVKNLNGNIVGEACLVDRSNDENLEKKLQTSVFSLLKIAVKTFDENNIPEELIKIKALKPGSRFLKL
jgi:orotate phosphoribosyltransferase